MRVNGLFIVFVIVAVLSLHLGATIYEQGGNNTIYNMTSHIDFNSTVFEPTNINITDNSSTILNTRITNIIYKTCDTIMYITGETSKAFIEIGYNNHEATGGSGIMNFLQFFMILVLIGLMFYPSLILAFFLYEGIKLLIKKIKR